VDSLNGWGADSVVLTPSEVASLVGDGMDAELRRQLDSLRVEPLDGELRIRARLRTGRLPSDVMGPLAIALRESEPIEAIGPLRVLRPTWANGTSARSGSASLPLPADLVPRVVEPGARQSGAGGPSGAGPAGGSRHPARARGRHPVWSEGLMSHRVLIVDDEAGIRQALKQVLEYEDLEVRVAASGGEAINLYTEFKPHLVFLDVKMAGLDGLETLTRLRNLDGGPQIVMISGTAPSPPPSRPPSGAPSISWKSRSTPTGCCSPCGTRWPTPSWWGRMRGSVRRRRIATPWWATARRCRWCAS
jgi:CheY-like chemotaxis protein